MGFGLISSESISDAKSLNSRRKIFYQYPTGAAPLMGLLSCLPSEDTDKPEFGWWERRFPTQRTATVASGTIPFLKGDGTAFADKATMEKDVTYQVRVVSTEQFKPTHVIEIRDVKLNDAASTVTIKGTVTAVVSATILKFRPYNDVVAVDNQATDNNGKVVSIIGTANAEGARSGNGGIMQFPCNPLNYTQIFRTAFSITRTALKSGVKYDSSGSYKMLARENGLRHMIEMEKAFLWGQKHTVLVEDPETGEQTPETKTGGFLWFLEQWEAANSIYRGGAGAAAITDITDPDKRIIKLGGTMTKVQYNKYMSNLFRKTNDKAYEKVCFCGGEFLETVNTLFEGQVQRQIGIQDKTRNWEFIVHSHTTLRGTVHYKVHPLFDEDPGLQGAALFLDLGNAMYRPLQDSDTVFLKGRQANDRDGRKDEWITEAGLELHFPESNMFISGANAAA